MIIILDTNLFVVFASFVVSSRSFWFFSFQFFSCSSSFFSRLAARKICGVREPALFFSSRLLCSSRFFLRLTLRRVCCVSRSQFFPRLVCRVHLVFSVVSHSVASLAFVACHTQFFLVSFFPSSRTPSRLSRVTLSIFSRPVFSVVSHSVAFVAFLDLNFFSSRLSRSSRS